jgi:hypothetical protein
MISRKRVFRRAWQFKKEPDGSQWGLEPCRRLWPVRAMGDPEKNDEPVLPQFYIYCGNSVLSQV